MNYRDLLNEIQRKLSTATLITPTGSIREDLSSANIFLMKAIDAIEHEPDERLPHYSESIQLKLRTNSESQPSSAFDFLIQ